MSIHNLSIRTLSIRALAAAGCVIASALTVVAPADASTAVPTRLHAVAATPTTMTLAWRAPAGAHAFRLQLSTHRSMASPFYRRTARTTGVVRHLAPGTRYYFRVASASPRTGARLSGYTRPAYPSSLTRLLATPQGLAISSTPTESTATLAWNRTVGATRYRVAGSTSRTFSNPTYTGSGGASATVAHLAPGTAYWFRVRAVRADGTGLSGDSAPLAVRTADAAPSTPPVDGPVDVRVASYNVLNVSLDKTEGYERPWLQRRDAVIGGILGQGVDVIGLQEAGQSITYASRLKDGPNQYLDIVNGIDKAGGHYALTNTYANNCVKDTTPASCVYQYRGASASDRIMYDTDRVSMVSQGSYEYQSQAPAGHTRFLAYAVLQMKSTGDRFLFTDTHLEVSDAGVRTAQWKELVAEVKELKGSLPVVSVGDFNVQKFDPIAESMLPAMKDAGFGDTLNQEYRVNPSVDVRAQHRVNAWVNSNNKMSPDVSAYSYADRRDKTGNSIDWIFATNSLEVKEWEMVLSYNPSTLMLTGVVPSDHNMIRATITLP